jgi:paraquat-inducible protein B
MSRKIPKVEESTKFNLITSIWIVPIVALFIALWLAWQHYSQLGPKIEIIFPKNEGLQAGQSQIKYKDVPMGKITKIELTEDGKGVIVHAQMEKMAAPYLNDTAKFWIVKPEVGVTGVSGLETLISGTYINMYAQKREETKALFYGLTHAYRKISEGEYFVLSAPEAYSVIKGTPLYFKNLEVGQVEYVTVGLDGKSINFIVFIDKAYVPYVHTDSKFWVMSTVDVDISSGHFDVNVAPLSNLIHSGIAFSSSGADSNRSVPDAFSFYLYKNVAQANEKKIGEGGKALRTYLVHTTDPIAKLNINAPVRYDGFDVGRVKEIALRYDSHTHKMKGNILVDIDTSSFEDANSSGEENFKKAVTEGLRARVTSTDPITGVLYVDLVFVEENASIELDENGTYAVLPSVPMESSSILTGVEKMIDKINRLPLNDLIVKLSQTVEDTDNVIKDVREPLIALLNDLKKSTAQLNAMTGKKSFKTLPDEVGRTLKSLQGTLRKTRQVLNGYDKNSLMRHQLSETLRSVTKTSEEMQQFLKMLNRKPNSLIFGDK